jgi:hypothetical protein
MKSDGRFARIPLWALDAKVSPQALRVLIAIAGHIDRDGRAFPSLSTIAALTGVARKNLPRLITELENAVLLRRERTTGGRGNPTRYQVVFAGPEKRPQEEPETSSPMRTFSRETVPSTEDVYPPKRPQNEPETSSPMRTEHKEQRRIERERARESWFMALRAAYPSRGAHLDPDEPAIREFEAALAAGTDPFDIVTRAKTFKKQMADIGREPRFIPTLAHWLRDRGWNDRPRPTEAAAPRRQVRIGSWVVER